MISILITDNLRYLSSWIEMECDSMREECYDMIYCIIFLILSLLSGISLLGFGGGLGFGSSSDLLGGGGLGGLLLLLLDFLDTSQKLLSIVGGLQAGRQSLQLGRFRCLLGGTLSAWRFLG